MRLSFGQKCFVIAGMLLISVALFALEMPALQGHINDHAKILSSKVAVELEEKLVAYEKLSTRQFAVLTVKTLGGEAIEDAAIKVANAWKLGTAKENNGLLLLISMGDRKIRIEVGSGIEDIYTDAFVGRIIDSIITPNFKQKNFDKGITEAIEALVLESVSSVENDNFAAILAIIVFALIIIFILGVLSDGGSSSGGFGVGYIIGSCLGGSSSGGGYRGGGGGFSGGGSSGSF